MPNKTDSTSVWTRENPSPRYRELLAQYQEMHVEGETRLNLAPQDTFSGKSLSEHVAPIRNLVAACGARTILDYGAGKGQQHARRDFALQDGTRVSSLREHWGVDSVTLYDPAYVPHSALPTGKFDVVICTDVLEHCPESDMRWIVSELFDHAHKHVYANVACYPAEKTLPSGENAHCTIRPPAWWRALLAGISADHAGVRYTFLLEIKKRGFFGRKIHRTIALEG